MSVIGDAGFALGFLDRCVLAVHDLLHLDATIRAFTGGALLVGTVTVSPASTSVVGVGTSFATDLTAGDRVLIDSQVAGVEDVAGNLALTLDTPHADGAIAAPIYRAGRIFRTDRPQPQMVHGDPAAWCYQGAFPGFDPAVGNLQATPSVAVSFRYAEPREILRDDAPSYSGLAAHVAQMMAQVGTGQTLCVPRFGNVNLTQRFASSGEGLVPVNAAPDRIEYAPTVQITWQARVDLGAMPAQRW